MPVVPLSNGFIAICFSLAPACEDEIIHQIIYLYLTSPYNSLRESFSTVLKAWSGTRVGEKAVQVIYAILIKLESIVDGSVPGTASSFEKQLADHYQFLVEEYQGERIKLVRLQIMMILQQLEDQKRESIAEYASTLLSTSSEWRVRQAAISALGQLGVKEAEVLDKLLAALADSEWSVRQAAATALGQLGVKEAEVLDKLLAALTDEDYCVRQAAAVALANLPFERTTIGEYIEKRLQSYSIFTGKQFSAHPTIDALLFALQLLTGEE